MIKKLCKKGLKKLKFDQNYPKSYGVLTYEVEFYKILKATKVDKNHPQLYKMAFNFVAYNVLGEFVSTKKQKLMTKKAGLPQTILTKYSIATSIGLIAGRYALGTSIDDMLIIGILGDAAKIWAYVDLADNVVRTTYLAVKKEPIASLLFETPYRVFTKRTLCRARRFFRGKTKNIKKTEKEFYQNGNSMPSHPLPTINYNQTENIESKLGGAYSPVSASMSAENKI